MFNCTVAEAEKCFPNERGMVVLGMLGLILLRFSFFIPVFLSEVVGWDWSPSSQQYTSFIQRELKDASDVILKCLNGDDAINFCTKNGIISGAGAIKIYSLGREVCVRRTSSSVYTVYGYLRASQIKELIAAVAEAQKTDTIAQVTF